MCEINVLCIFIYLYITNIRTLRFSRPVLLTTKPRKGRVQNHAPNRAVSLVVEEVGSGRELEKGRDGHPVSEELVKKKAVDEAIKSAYMKDDHLVGFPAFHTYDRNGLLVRLESGSGEHLSSPLKRYIQELLKVNMQGAYGPEWAAEEKIKRREMVAPEARYIFVRSMQSADNEHLSNINNMEEVHECHWSGDGDPVVAFVHYRFIVEEEIPVVYVYELQLEQCVQGRGLGKFLMQLIELIARKNHMKAVMLTVQKRNISAMNFYTSKLRYIISSISPSRVDPLIGAEKSYEILCKTFDSEAKTKLEEDGSSGAE